MNVKNPNYHIGNLDFDIDIFVKPLSLNLLPSIDVVSHDN